MIASTSQDVSEASEEPIAEVEAAIDTHAEDTINIAALSVSPGTSLFEDLPIDRSGTSFRLWRFKPDCSPDCISLELRVFQTDDCPRYTALSYVWGSTNDFTIIEVNGKKHSITMNLYSFLSMILREWDDQYSVRMQEHNVHDDYTNIDQESLQQHWFWADQISMDQQNLLERNHQVGMMQYIFSTAESVCAYLGPEPRDPDLSIHLVSAVRDELPDDEALHSILRAVDLFSRDYWRRLWIVQEMYLGHRLLFWCGSVVISAYRLFKDFFVPLDLHLRILWKAVSKSSDTEAENLRDQICQLVDFRILDQASGDGTQQRAIDHILSHHAEKSLHEKPTLTLVQALRRFCQNQCSDPRDRVYGLQALVREQQHVKVNYERTLLEVVVDTAKTIITHSWMARTPYGQSLFDMTWTFMAIEDKLGDNIDDLFDLLEKLIVIPPHSRQQIETILWGYLVANLSRQINDVMLEGYKQTQLAGFCKRKIWDRIYRHALTTHQQAFALRLQISAQSARLKSAIQEFNEGVSGSNIDLADGESELDEDKLAVVCSTFSIETENTIVQIASDLGFVKHGDFLSHPDDWPFLLGLPEHPLDNEARKTRTKLWHNDYVT